MSTAAGTVHVRTRDQMRPVVARPRPPRPTAEPAERSTAAAARTRDRLVTALSPEPDVPQHTAQTPAPTIRDRLADALTSQEQVTAGPEPLTLPDREAAAEAVGPVPQRRRATTTGDGPGTVTSRPRPLAAGTVRRSRPAGGDEHRSAPRPPGARAPTRPPGSASPRAPPRVFTKLHVTGSGDPCELEAEAVAAAVLRARSERGWSIHDHDAPAGPSLTATTSGQGGGVPLPEGVDAAVGDALAAPGLGRALPRDLRARIEPVLRADLSRVRVREDAASATAARALGARAFTVGSTIHLGPGGSSSDVGLMAHEATHVVQQGLAPARGPPLAMRAVSDYLPDISVTDVIPDAVLDAIRTAVRAIPGYVALTYVVGEDLLTHEPVRIDIEALLDAVLTYGPFGPAVGTVLRGLSILQEIYQAVTDRLAAHDLTLARIGRDLRGAWDELSVTNGIDGNVAILRRYVDAFLRDLDALVTELVDEVLALVRRAVVAVAEPFLERPEIAPIWNLAKEVLRYDPLRGVEVQVPTTQIIADFLTLIGESERLEQMRERGTLQETADWLDTQMLTFLDIAGELSALFSDAWEAIQPQNLPDLLDTLPGLADRAVGLVRRIADFGLTLITKVLELVKKALLGWLSEHAHTVPGFHLLTVIIGENPFTGEDVPRTAASLIRGFITLLPDGEATYEQLAESGVVTEAADRIEGAMTRLGISLEMVLATFRGVWDTLSLDDLLQPVAAFGRVLARFGQPLARIVEFVGVVLRTIVELILRLMNFPTELLGNVITNAMSAIADIRRDPVGFLKNTLTALKLGFSGFFDRIGGYLLDGLVAWIFRGLGQLGIALPTDFSLSSILGLVLDVLGLSVEYLWTKLGEHIGPEKVALMRRSIDTLGGAWQFLADVQREGLPAVWRFLSDQLSNLWQTLLDMALDWVTRTVVERAITKVLSFLDPTGVMAVVNSAIAIFNAIQSAIEYINDLLQVLDRYVSTLAAVAAGNVGPGAQMLEQGLASIIPIAIGFLAAQVGLGNIPEKVVEIIGGLRQMVDQAVDWLIRQALRLGRAVLDALGGGRRPEPTAAPAGGGADAGAITETVPVEMDDAGHTLTFQVVGGQPTVTMASERAEFLRTMTVAASAREERKKHPRQRLVDGLDKIAAELKDLVEDWHAAYSKSDADKRAAIKVRLGEIAGLLRFIGREWKIKDLEHLGHASKHVEGNRLAPPWDEAIRSWAYPSGYLQATITWRDDRLEELRHPTDRSLFRDESTGAYEPTTAGNVTVDHKPRVVEHWNNTGKDVDQKTRRDYYNDVKEANLQLVARKNNSADGARARAMGHLYQTTVGDGFLGPLDDE